MERAHDVGDEALVRTVMRRQARLGLRIAAVFVLILVGLPLLNLYLPETMAARVGGFSLTWLFLAVLFYPVTWLLSWIFVSGSDRAEDALVAEMRGRVGLASRPPLQNAPPGEGGLPPDREVRGSGDPRNGEKRKLFVEEDAE